MRTAIYGAAIVALAVGSFGATAGDCCSQCGCQCECQKICRLVPDERKIDAHCWGCKCEDFCVTGCSERGCEHCETICDPCENAGDPKAPCARAKPFVWFDWCPPTKAKMYTRTKLYRKDIVRKVPSYKWVVEDLCPRCASNCAPNSVVPPAPAGGAVPPAPPAAGPSASLSPAELPVTATK